VVAAASQGPGILIEEEKNGLLCAVDDADGLARTVSRALGDRDLMMRMATGGYRDFANKFSEAVVVGQYLEFFERIAADAAKKGAA
jgi:glycosyltransferase involved in cell wall biosynthesis